MKKITISAILFVFLLNPVFAFATNGTINTNTNNPPSISLLGSNPLSLVVNNVFTDPGATAIDTEDGDLTSSIVVTGSVSTSTVGTSTLVYSVTDSDGASASTTRTVVVSATTTSVIEPPVTPPINGGGSPPTDSGSSSGGGGSSSGIGGHRRDVSNLFASSGSVLGATTDTSCSYLRDYLRRDWNNDRVEMLKLQSFLNVFEKESLALNGTFDGLTFEAVSRFQNKYFNDILAPWGHTAPTGFVYILTKKKINEIYCNTKIALTPEQQDEITNFNKYLKNLNLDVSVSSSIRNLQRDGTLPIDLSDFVGANTGREESSDSKIESLMSVATGVKDKVLGVTESNALKNLAISAFGAPKGLKEISSTYLLILLGLILIAVFAPKRGSKPSITVLEKTKVKAPVVSLPKVESARPTDLSGQAPKPEDFEDPALASATSTAKSDPILMGPATSEDKDDTRDKGFKGIIG